jgi:hypothetical protein
VHETLVFDTWFQTLGNIKLKSSSYHLNASSLDITSRIVLKAIEEEAQGVAANL